MKRKRFVKTVMGIGALSLLLAACSQQEAEPQNSKGEPGKKDKEQITLTFANWGTVEASTKEGYEAMIKGFEDKHPNIKIENIGVPFNQMLDQLLVMNAGGSPPDVSILHGTWTSTMYEAGALEPLNDLLPDEVQKDYYDNLIQNVTYDDKLVAAPWTPAASIIYYNKELLRNAGIEQPPKTLAELREQAAIIAKQGKDKDGNTIYGMGIQSKRLFNAGFYYLPYIWEQGGDLTDKDGKVTLNTPEVINALTETKRVFDNELTPVGLEIKDLRSLFSQGRVGFHIDIDAYGILLDLSPEKEKFAQDLGMIQIPEAFFLEYAIGVSSKSKHKEAAAQFVEYLGSPEAMKIFNDHGANRSAARESTAAIDFYQKPENAHMQFYLEAIQAARPLPVRNPGFVKAMEEIAEAVQRVGINHEEPAQVAKELQEKVEKIYGK